MPTIIIPFLVSIEVTNGFLPNLVDVVDLVLVMDYLKQVVLEYILVCLSDKPIDSVLVLKYLQEADLIWLFIIFIIQYLKDFAFVIHYTLAVDEVLCFLLTAKWCCYIQTVFHGHLPISSKLFVMLQWCSRLNLVLDFLDGFLIQLPFVFLTHDIFLTHIDL
jgi:hypothetical protein